MSSTAACLLVLLATGARPPHYGGDVINYVYGEPIQPDPARTQTAADAAAHAAAYEPLYRVVDGALVPVLARDAPKFDGLDVLVPLRRGVRRHDGALVSPRAVIAALARLADIPAARYVLAPLQRRDGRLGMSADDESFAVRFALSYRDPHFPYLLATDHARLAWPRLRGPPAGTGPFLWASDSEQRPFPFHRAGRPYLDRLVWKVHASRFGASKLVRKGRVPVFGAPTVPRAVPGPGTWLVLQVGPSAGTPDERAAIVQRVQTKLGRRRLVRRYLGPHASPALGFISQPVPTKPGPQLSIDRELELQVPSGLRFDHRLAGRLKLELFRLGLKVQTRQVDPAAWTAGDAYDLRLTEVRAGVSDDGTPRAAAHRLMSIAAALSVLPQLPAGRLAGLADVTRAGGPAEKAAAALAATDRSIRQASGTVVIGRLPPAVALPQTWPAFAFDWGDLELGASP